LIEVFMNLWNDVRYAARMLVKSPGFAIAAILTLGLGIGATTAIFSCADALLWKPVPLPHLESLVMVGQRAEDPEDFESATPADIEDLRQQTKTLGSLASWQGGLANIVASGGQPDRALQSMVSANFFDVMGVQPARGRAFQAGEDQPGREREVIFSHDFWRNRFGGDPDIVGKTIRLDDQDYVILGVMPPKYEFPLGTDVWTPLALTPEQRTSRKAQLIQSVARLQPGVTIEQAISEGEGLSGRLRTAYPATNKVRHFAVLSAHRYLVDKETNQYLVMLLCSVAFVLLIACANVANLQFARATGRLREVAVRTALGAGRMRIIVQLVTESVLLALAGGAFGLVIAYWALNLTRAGMPPEIERYIVGWRDMQLDGRALAFTMAAALISGILAGLAPAWQNSRPNLVDALKEGGRGSSGTRNRHFLRNLLVGGEIALAVVLLVGASLMFRGFHNLLVTGERLEPATLLTLRMTLTESKYHDPHQIAAFYGNVLDRLNSLPSVRSAAAVVAMPYGQHSNSRYFTIEGQAPDPDHQPSAMWQITSASYFDLAHVPLQAGRLLNQGDGAEAPRTTVVSDSVVKLYWKGKSPIGQRIKMGAPDSKQPWMTVVGVVGDVPHNPYDREPRRAVYIPYLQSPALWMDIGVRTAGNPLLVASAVTAAIHAVDPEQPVTEMRTMEKAIYNAGIGLQYVEIFMGVFGVLALVLSAIGVYGVMAYMVSEQTHDIGLRMALGAPRGNVLATIFRRGMLTAACGLAVGLPAAYGLALLTQSLIFGVTAKDPITFIGIPLVLLGATAVAILVPARRAMRIDPIVALRYE
jgi:putative ABC transport system permease protein